MNAACATYGEQSLIDFNKQFSQQIPTSPQYRIDQVGPTRFQIVTYQGAALIAERTTRLGYLTRASLLTMERHCTETGGKLGTYQFVDSVDSVGYVNQRAMFTCAVVP